MIILINENNNNNYEIYFKYSNDYIIPCINENNKNINMEKIILFLSLEKNNILDKSIILDDENEIIKNNIKDLYKLCFENKIVILTTSLFDNL